MKNKETKLNLKFFNLSYKQAKRELVDLLIVGPFRDMLAIKKFGDVIPADLMFRSLQTATASKKNWAYWKKSTIGFKADIVKHQLKKQS